MKECFEGFPTERSYNNSNIQYIVVFDSGTVSMLHEMTCEISYGFSLSLTSFCSCWKGGICALWYWEHKLVDHRRCGDSPPCGHHHHFHPILETVSHWQAGVPARCHDLYSAETEGRVVFYFYFFYYSVQLNCQEVELLLLRTLDTLWVKY